MSQTTQTDIITLSDVATRLPNFMALPLKKQSSVTLKASHCYLKIKVTATKH